VDNELLNGFYLDDRLVCPLTGEVTNGSRSAHLQPKAMEVLLVLARNPRHLVTHERILERVWGDRVGRAGALSHAVSEIRRALDDQPDDPRFVQTVPTRGYRLLKEPRNQSDDTKHNAIADLPRTGGIWSALIRHGVVQASVAYLIAGWFLIQVADATFDTIGLPAWGEQFVTFAVIGGLPVVILLAWFLEFAGGRMTTDTGTQNSGILGGLERNYLAIFAAYGVAFLSASAYQATVGFEIATTTTSINEPELVPVAENSLAVLRFVSIDRNSDSRIFSDGLSEDVLDGLASLPGLLVSSRGDAWSLPPNSTSNAVRRRLRVAYFIEGSVRLAGDNLKVVVQLIETKTGFHVFSKSIETKTIDLPSVQNEITKQVVSNLRLGLPDTTGGVANLAADTDDIDAYVLYRRGLEVFREPRSAEVLVRAATFFRESIAVDPNYPAAYAGLCDTYRLQHSIDNVADNIVAADAACTEAARLGPQLPMVLGAVGRLAVAKGFYDGAEPLFEQALRVNAQYVPAIRGLAKVKQLTGKPAEAEELLQRSVELQPGNWRSMDTLGTFYFAQGRFAEAALQYRKALYLDQNNFALLSNLGGAEMMAGNFERARATLQKSVELQEDATAYTNLGIAQYYLGDFDQSVIAHRRAVELEPQVYSTWLNLGDSLYFANKRAAASDAYRRTIELAEQQLDVNSNDSYTLTSLAWGKAMTGEFDEARGYAARAVDVDSNDPYSHYYVALIELKAGNQARAVASIEAALKTGYDPAVLAIEPHLEKLRSNPKFDRLLAEYGMKGEE